MGDLNIQNLLIDWISKRPKWFAYPLNDILDLKEITDSDIKHYADLCINETQDTLFEKNEIDFHQLGIIYNQNDISILEISDMQNVNAISPGRKLMFNSNGITVIYGDNGSGKSGYVRALKKACGVPGSEPIKRNIYRTKSHNENNPRCTIKLSSLDKPLVCDLSLDAKPYIKDITVFDTSISMDYIGKTREASFEPRVFSVLSKLANTVDKVKGELIDRRESIKPFLPEIPIEIKDASIFDELRTINHDTILKFEDFSWDETDESTLQESINILSENNPIEKINHYRQKLESIEHIMKYTQSLSEFYSNKNVDEIKQIYTILNRCFQEELILSGQFAEVASEIDKEGITNSAWKHLWKYANEYMNQIKNSVVYENACPLCSQPMNGKILDRFNTINDFVNSKISSEISSCKDAYQKAIKTNFDLLNRQALELLFNNCDLTINKELFVESLYNASILILQLQQQNLDDYRSLVMIPSNFTFHEIIQSLRDQKMEIEGKIEKLNSLINDFELEKLKKKVLDLQVRKYCKSMKSVYEDAITSYKEIFRIANAEKISSTNAITIITNTLADELLSKEYEDNFNKELTYLTSGSVKVKLKKAKSGKGRVPFKIQIEDENGNGYSPNEILSEGEQRVVSIAAFIADNSIGKNKNPLIFDDPISSLDFRYEGKTVDRIVELAKSRQIIVFTHRLSMVHAINSSCTTAGVEYLDTSIVSSPSEKGIPTERSVTKVSITGTLSELLNDSLPKLKKIDVATLEYQTTIRGICSRFRETVEKSVEEILLCNIASRFQREIRTKNVPKLKRLSDNDCDIVDQMMSKYSIFEHSHSQETPFSIPEYSELENDLSNYLKWVKDAKKRLSIN